MLENISSLQSRLTLKQDIKNLWTSYLQERNLIPLIFLTFNLPINLQNSSTDLSADIFYNNLLVGSGVSILNTVLKEVYKYN